MTTNTSDTTTSTAAALVEPSMDDYAKMRMTGGVAKPAPVAPAATTEQEAVAAATDEEIDSSAAAAANSDQEDGKTTSAPATEEDPVSKIEEAHPAKKGISKRFSELTAEKKALQAKADEAAAATEAANRRADEAVAESARLRAEAEKAQAAVPKVVDAAEDPAPNRHDFDDPDEFTAAISAHATRQEIRKSTQAAQDAAAERAAEAQKQADAARQAQVNASIDELHRNFKKRVDEIKPEYPDYKEMVQENDTLVIRNDIFFTIQKSTDAPHILYHLASNPEIVADLDKLHPIDAAIRIGEMQAELRQARKPKVTRAAAPIKPVGNRASPQQKTPNEETTEEYAARRTKEMQAAQKNRSRILS